ncbi:MAG: hypothetical protein B6U76_00165 [Desulfurococcales archaeon ex4484_217_2]|nr:MAG: hypothetical protein B6U76_00165 [Desulfurococcales archaeon ex4484_217_2]
MAKQIEANPTETFKLTLYVGQGDTPYDGQYGYKQNVVAAYKFGSLAGADVDEQYKNDHLYSGIWSLYGSGTEDVTLEFGYVGDQKLASNVDQIDLTFENPDPCGLPASVSLVWDGTDTAYKGTASSVVDMIKDNHKNTLQITMDVVYS